LSPADDRLDPDAEDAELLRFRSRLRSWLAEHIPMSEAPFDDERKKLLAGGLYDAGFGGLTWPQVYGGRALGADYQTVFNQESAAYTSALPSGRVTVGICAPVLLEFGTEEQKTLHIPRMLRGDDAWTQLLSEPGAGSDLASVATRAQLTDDGENWLLTGQKVWTSRAVQADFALAFVRTSTGGPRRRGLSMLIVDMTTPGVDVRPLREMTGETVFNEVFLDEVRVPRGNIVGDVNDGWAVLLRMLHHERIALSAGTTGSRMTDDPFPRLLSLAKSNGAVADPAVRSALTDVYLQQRLMDALGRRIRAASQAGLSMGPVGSLGKICVAEAARHAAETGLLITGPRGQAWSADDTDAERAAYELLFFPCTGIAGGTTEIQKNTVAERLLGLPREHAASRDNS
jgi:alkylation response protein AidB-like acyl-CoA dehydrogenase